MKKKPRVKYYYVTYKEVEYIELYVEATSKEEAEEKVFQLGNGSSEGMETKRVSKAVAFDETYGGENLVQ